MRFNLSASVKHVAQLLNPDLEIPNGPTSLSQQQQQQQQRPPLQSRTSSSSSSARRSVPSTRSRGNTLSLRSSLSSRHKRRQTTLYTSPPTSTTSEDPVEPLTSIQADYAASTSRDPTIRFYNPVPSTPAPQKPQHSRRISWKRRSTNTTGTNKPSLTTNKMSNLSKKRSSWNGFQSKPGPPPPATITTTAATTTTTTTPSTNPQTDTPSVSSADKSKPYFPLAGIARDGYSNAKEATATCFCGAVQLAFPVSGPGLLSTFVCNCADCRKITASMFASNFTVRDDHLKHLRGKANLSKYSQATTIASGHNMTNYFCSTCGTLMYRVGAAFPGCSILRLGTVDDFNLVETKLKPTRELFVKDRVAWFSGVQGEGIKRKSAML